MFKKISYIVFLFSSFCYSQLSNKHWLPPLHCRDASSVADHYLYLSTQETEILVRNIKTIHLGKNIKSFSFPI